MVTTVISELAVFVSKLGLIQRICFVGPLVISKEESAVEVCVIFKVDSWCFGHAHIYGSEWILWLRMTNFISLSIPVSYSTVTLLYELPIWQCFNNVHTRDSHFTTFCSYKVTRFVGELNVMRSVSPECVLVNNFLISAITFLP